MALHFFLIQIEVVRIGDSLPAPRFNVIAKPNDWLKAVKQSTTAGSVSDLKLQQQAFFEEVRTSGKAQDGHVRSWATPRPQHWYDIRVGSSKGQVRITLNSQKTYVGVEFYVKTKDTYSELQEYRDVIEDSLGMTCDWQELPGKQASRIQVVKEGDFRDDQRRDELRDWVVTTTDRFAQVFSPYL